MDTAAVFYGKENANSITWHVPQKHERATHRVFFFPLIGTSMSGRLRKERGPWDAARPIVVAG